MEHQQVPVGILEERHVAGARIARLPVELDTLRLERSPGGANVRNADREAAQVWRERLTRTGRVEDVQGDLSAAKFHVVRPFGLELEAERLPVELLRPLDVLRQKRDEVDLLDFNQPTEPSICSWISRFISTAYSSGSSFVIGSTKPDTIRADASASESPRDIR